MSQARTYALTDPAALTARVRAAGGPAIDPTDPTGVASNSGVTLSWAVTPGRIVITILSKPWIIPYGTIWDHVDDLLGAPLVS